MKMEKSIIGGVFSGIPKKRFVRFRLPAGMAASLRHEPSMETWTGPLRNRLPDAGSAVCDRAPPPCNAGIRAEGQSKTISINFRPEP